MKLKAGIIGLGVGEAHIAGYQAHPNCEVVALCDFSEEKLAEMRQKYPDMRLTHCADEILQDPDIDVVSIASYDSDHYEQMVRAIQSGKHLFVEKPLCLHGEELKHIRSLLSQQRSLKLSSNLILRMSPRFQWLKNRVTENRLGQLYFAEGSYNYGRRHKITDGWRGQIDFYSVVLGGGIHMIDLLLWLTGDHVVEVSACGNQMATAGSSFRYNDFVIGLLKFQSGALGKVSANFSCIFPHFHELSLYGTKGTFCNGMKNGLLFESADPHQSPTEITEAYPGVRKGDLLYDFVEAIVKNRTPIISTEEIFRSMSIAFAIEKAAKEKKWIEVEYI